MRALSFGAGLEGGLFPRVMKLMQKVNSKDQKWGKAEEGRTRKK